MRRLFALTGMVFLLAHLIPGLWSIPVIVAVFVLLRLLERCATAMTDMKILLQVSEQPRSLQEIRELIAAEPLTLPEILSALISGQIVPSEPELYFRIRELSGNPIRPFHPMLGRIQFRDDELLPVWLSVTPSWKPATSLPREIVQARRAWGQTNGTPDADSEMVREFSIDITAEGKRYLFLNGAIGESENEGRPQ